MPPSGKVASPPERAEPLRCALKTVQEVKAGSSQMPRVLVPQNLMQMSQVFVKNVNSEGLRRSLARFDLLEPGQSDHRYSECLQLGYAPGAVERTLPAQEQTGKLIFMRYRLEIKDEAREQLRALPKEHRRNIGWRLDQLQSDLAGDVKKLAARTQEYRLRAGSFRVLFMLEGDLIVVYAVKDRKEAYE